ncbi:MAG: hypothetical protein KC590_12710 [Nitrospira sp.]|nr:hypothetical protein [Nitrospira sp.]MCA9478841.1 hypothetical protein [Nitrospira sp.]MCB9710223.1 hypothetical protein [Nitrospiraceae bacterium]
MAHARTLTHDEIKASEAAFRGLPFNPKWSNSAKLVYDGIIQALGHAPITGSEDASSSESSDLDPTGLEESNQEQETLPEGGDEADDIPTLTLTTGSFPLTCRKDAIQSGIVKDATPAAKRIGLDYPVGLTNALWNHYVAFSDDASEDHITSRLQDMMVGVRLRLASLKEAVPFIDVPILLQFPPEPIPQLNLVFALFHRDPEEGQCLLLIHPSEIFSPRQNISNN